MKEKGKKKTALNDWGTLIDDFTGVKEEFNALPKSGKIFSIVAFLVFMGFGIYFLNNLFPNLSEADRMRNRIAELQKEIIEQTKLVSYAQYSAQKSAMQARRSLANGISNPMGASEADRKNYQEGIDNLEEQGDIASDTLAQIEAEKAEIEKIQQNLAAGVYKEK